MNNKYLPKKKEAQAERSINNDAFGSSLHPNSFLIKNEKSANKEEAKAVAPKKRIRYWENTILNSEDAAEIVD